MYYKLNINKKLVINKICEKIRIPYKVLIFYLTNTVRG